MEVDFTSDLSDDKLFDGVLDDSDVWGKTVAPNEVMDHSFSRLLDLDPEFSADDFMKDLPEDLELPMLHNGDILSTALGDIPLEDHHSDSSDSGIDSCFPGVIIKNEPLSPGSASMGSENSQDSGLSSATSIGLPGGLLGAQVAPGSPPLLATDGITIVKHEIPDISGRGSSIQQQQQPMRAIRVLSGVPPTSSGSSTSVVEMESGSLTPPLTPTSSAQSRLVSAAGTQLVGKPVSGNTTRQNGPVPMKIITVPGEGGTVVKMLVPAEVKEEGKSHIKPVTLSSGQLGSKTILKSVAPIQPKSGSNPGGASKTLVLTLDEFSKLSSQKILSVKSSGSTPSPTTASAPLKPVVTAPASLVSSTPSFVSKPAPVTVTHTTKPAVTCLPQTESDIKSIKRQQRMMKNRESACLSRKRKKEYMATLEAQLKDYSTENNKLKNENLTLRKTITILQCENEKLKKSLPPSAMKGATVLLGVLLLLSLNLGPLWSISAGTSPTDSLRKEADSAFVASSHHGRALMSFDYDYSQSEGVDVMDHLRRLDRDWTKLKSSLHLRREGSAASPSSRGGTTSGSGLTSTELMLAQGIEDLTKSSMCPTYLNSSESQRLLNDLRGWVRGHEEQQKREQEKREHQSKQQDHSEGDGKQSGRRKNRSRKKHLSKKMPGSVTSQPNMVDLDYYSGKPAAPSYGVQMFTGAEQQYQNFLKNLQRRNDTFYVVSFRRDHLLLPATAHNKTMRPRMSVVMPAMGLNETMSPPDGSISMLQIDCEVTATQLVHIHRQFVPEHLDPNVTQHADPHRSDADPHQRLKRDTKNAEYWRKTSNTDKEFGTVP